MGFNKFDPGCCCDCPQIGFAGSACLSFSGCCPSGSPIINLKADLARISECVAVFMGACQACNFDSAQFADADWPTVKTYIRSGGRLFITAENQATGPSGSFCFSDASKAKLNSFLDSIGSAISYVGGNGFIGPAGPNAADAMQPGPANIAQGLAPVYSNLFGAISGGTVIWKLDAYEFSFNQPGTRGNHVGIKTVVAGEQLGSGFVFVTGDVNHADATPPPGWCDFVKRLWNYGNDQIL